jgi:ABC-type branched-subunit amino acid transport system ATPase component
MTTTTRRPGRARGGAATSPQARAAVATADALAETTERVRVAGREAMGVSGVAQALPLRRLLSQANVGVYPLVALGVLVVIDQFQGVAFGILGPEIARSLGLSKVALAGIVSIKTLAITVFTLPMAALVQRGRRRARTSIVTGFAWSIATLFTGFVIGPAGLLVLLVLDGVSTASVTTVHQPLLLDSYPPPLRVRVLFAYRGFDHLGNVLTPLLVAVLAGLAGFSWRGVFLAMGVTSLVATVVAVKLRDPGFGRWDADEIRARVRDERGETSDTSDAVGEQASDDAAGPSYTFFETTRRLLLIPTVRRVLAANAVLGLTQIPLATFLVFFLEERWGMSPGARSVLFAGVEVAAIATLVIFAPRGEALYRADPAKLVRTSVWVFLAATMSVAVAFASPLFAVMAVCLALSASLLAALTPALAMALLNTIPAPMRPQAAALAGLSFAAVGGTGGLVLLGGVDSRYGTTGIVVVIALSGVVVSRVLYGASRTIRADLDRTVEEIIEEEAVRELVANGQRLPLLDCRRIDFSYGQLQVLFGVDFTVDEGEMVALLGTNGAGKSTLLRVISGLGFPSGGTVRYRGTDVTYLDGQRRVGLGMVQVPGGRAVFDSLSVIDNLRLFGYAAPRSSGQVERGIERCFEVFPRLAERRDSLASRLSGGEQQMLGLSQAFVLQPSLLLIDELSLGLAPKVVGELLEMVRQINKTGTAVVLVEQSLNVALSLVDHAYFMEKGEIRFDGRADELAQRPDLLRSVFLEGAAKVMEAR